MTLPAGPSWGYALAGVGLLLFAASILLTRLATARVPLSTGFVVSLAVNVLVAALVFGVELALRQRPLALDGGGIVSFLVAGVLTTYLGRWFFYGCVARLGPAKASTFHVSSRSRRKSLGDEGGAEISLCANHEPRRSRGSGNDPVVNTRLPLRYESPFRRPKTGSTFA